MSPTARSRTPGRPGDAGVALWAGWVYPGWCVPGSWSMDTWVLPMNQDILGLGSLAQDSETRSMRRVRIHAPSPNPCSESESWNPEH